MQNREVTKTIHPHTFLLTKIESECICDFCHSMCGKLGYMIERGEQKKFACSSCFGDVTEFLPKEEWTK